MAQVHPFRGGHVILYLIASNKVPLFSTFTTLEDVGILVYSGRSILVRPNWVMGLKFRLAGIVSDKCARWWGGGCNPCAWWTTYRAGNPRAWMPKRSGGEGGGIPVVHCNPFYYGVQLLITAVDVNEYLLIKANMDTRYIVQWDGSGWSVIW